MATELVLKFRGTCETAPAPWPPPAHGRPTTSGKAPEALVGLGVLQEVLVVPLPRLGPVKFLSGQVEGITAEVKASEEDEDGTARRKKGAGPWGISARRRRTRSKKGAGEDAPAEGMTSEEDKDCTAQPENGAGLWSSGAPSRSSVGRG